ncbi:transglutaminase domain-containing protein [Lysinibacillus irui]|uniref:Transglutaminase domain-containing protein n=1 Tax=Lysinibacillus irui TaxID=2998077 RepID=A0AAJ5RJ02_9BACI|nr:transglutaminase domain-containing protein [Lysinibacillus irui]MEA0555803.1 transglutaminase domain-containing protein [Lysinibacillus irui]MEA0976969.1 transglutaminase domain-containing protein [Lysinibacillus irui]MEA1043123.1 transglutaminase domain-containing protein [Lysinibacillus irui]WDV06421.1 transglutaminase domain-containing protein [Lysinibacillus irui]
MKQSLGEFIELAIAYIIVFFILREWLIPIMQLTNTGGMNLFLVFIGMSLALSLLRVHPLLSGFVKFSYITWFIVFVYSKSPVLSRETVPFLLSEWKGNMATILSGDFGQVSDAFRTVLFLVLIWMLVYLIHHWVSVRKNIFYFFAMTVFFIATLDTFSDYDGKAAIVKVVVLGLIMTGVLFVKRLWLQMETTSTAIEKWKIVIPMLVSVLLVSSVAFFLPKTGPTWADPVPFIQGVTGQDGNGAGEKSVGYSQDDSQLGGPFQGDNTLIFTASSRDRHYWRIETKDTYTSKGWVVSEGNFGKNVYETDTPILTSLQVGPSENERHIQLDIAIPMPFLIQTYGLISVSAQGSTLFIQDEQTEKMMIEQQVDESKSLSNYSLSYSEPVYSMEQLQLSYPSTLETLDSSFNRFLQLPNQLPQRVRDLASEITQGKASVYDQIKAVESYFRTNGFRYDKKEAAIPAENQDYVDQFLFDTKVGYCDNFSTSMVVLLRSVGIPARWVKGFAPGTAGPMTDGLREYQVTNDNAHSWVEAYIPGAGWMEFEPTIGFSGNVNIDYDVPLDTSDQEEVIQPEQKPEQKKQQKEVTEKVQSPATFSLDAVWTWLKKYTYVWIGIIVLLIITGISLYLKRKTWIPKMHVRSYRKKAADWSNFDSSYQVLLKQLSRIGLRRRDGETLRAFAERVDLALETDEMQKLTVVYEQHVYGKDKEDVDFIKLKESWEYLINRTIS